MNEVLKKYKKERIALAKLNHQVSLYNDHKANMIIRKMDSSVNRIKEHNQKNPKEFILVPNAKIHKILV